MRWGDTTVCMQTPWEKTLDFHGNVCPELVLGFRAAEAGLRALKLDVADGSNLVAVAENNSCGVDAVQVVTGCTMGRGNLVVRDWGKQVYTFARRDTGQAVRVAVRYKALWWVPELQALQGGSARELSRHREDVADQLLEMPEDELLELRAVAFDSPPAPEAAGVVACAGCGEGVLETRAKVRDGRLLCISCFGV